MIGYCDYLVKGCSQASEATGADIARLSTDSDTGTLTRGIVMEGLFENEFIEILDLVLSDEN